MATQSTDDEIPHLLAILPSQDDSQLLQIPQNVGNDSEMDENRLPIEWIVDVKLSKRFTEKQLWQAFRILYYPEDERQERLPTMFSLGIKEDGKEVPLFEDQEKLDDEEQKAPKNPFMKQLKNKRQKKQQKKEPTFDVVCFWVKLVNAKDFGDEEDGCGCDDCHNCDDDECQDCDDHCEEHAHEDHDHEEHEGHNETPYFEPEILDTSDLEQLLQVISTAAHKLDSNAKVVPNESIPDAVKRANALAEMVDHCDRSVAIVLNNPNGYKGPDIWNAMLALDLQFDTNYGSFILSDEEEIDEEEEEEEEDEGMNPPWFTVITNAGPRKFTCEWLADPKSSTTDLTFNLYLPQSKDPFVAINLMEKAAKYVQSKLGGVILSEYGKPFSSAELKEEVSQSVTLMKKFGIPPGSLYAMELF